MNDRLVITVEYKGKAFATYITDKMSIDQVYVDRVLSSLTKHIKYLLKSNEFTNNENSSIPETST